MDGKTDAAAPGTSYLDNKGAGMEKKMEFKVKDLPADNILSEDGEDVLNPCTVFLCYEASDKDFVWSLNRALRSGVRRDIWVDWDNVELSPSWQDELHKGIENTDVFVCVCSANSNRNEKWNLCVDHALKNGKRIVVVCPNRTLDTNLVNKKLQHIEWVLFNSDGSDFAPSVSTLIHLIDDEQRHAQYHTTILRRAITWERYDFEKSLLLKNQDLLRAQHWLSASALGRQPKPTTLHLSFITASASLSSSMKKRRLIAMFFGVIVTIGIIWPTWGVFFFSLIFSHFFVYFSSHDSF